MQKILVATVAILMYFFGYSQKNEKGWKMLFNEKSLDGWKQLTGTAKYYVEDGMIVGVSSMGSPNSFLAANGVYGDFRLEFDFMLEDTALNSGVQFRSHYNSAGKNGEGFVYGYQYEMDGTIRNWSGGIYDEARRGWLYTGAYNNDKKRTYNHGGFNNAIIICKGNTVQTWINNKLISILVDTATTPGLIAVQVHSISNKDLDGKKIYWKNIRIKTKQVQLIEPSYSSDLSSMPRYIANTIPNNISDVEAKYQWKLLFDGKTSTGWKGAYKPGFPEKGWKIEDGILKVLKSTGGESTNGGDIVTIKKYIAFDLSFEFKLSEGANSGLKYFVTLSENNPGSAIGLEFQVLDDEKHPDAKKGRDGNRTLASLYDLIKAEKQARFTKKIGEWNTGRVVVHPDNRVEHYLNGIKVLDYVRGSQAFRDLVAVSKYKIWPNFGEAPEGHILLQDHGDEVHFRSIKIRVLE